MKRRTILEFSLFFNHSTVLNEGLQENPFTVLQHHHAARLIRWCAQCTVKSWKKLFNRSPFADFLKAVACDMLFHNRIRQFPIFAMRFMNSSPLLQKRTLMDAGVPQRGEKRVVHGGFDHSASTDDALCKDMSLMSDQIR